MKILQVMAGAETGGAETAFIDTCIALAEAGFEIEAATRPNSRNARLATHGIPCHELKFGGVLDLRTRRKLKTIIAAFRPQIVQTWMSRAARMTPADPERYLKISRLGGYYALTYFRSTDYFMTITPDIRRYLIAEGIAPDRVSHINNFAETEADAAPVARESLATPGDAVAVLTLSRLHKSKALDTLMRAARDLPEIHLWLAGEGPDRDELQALAAELGIADRAHFLGWRSDRASLLAGCDICCFPSRYEPFGTVFVQAWQAGKPLVVSNAQGPAQYVRDREDGLVFEIDDVAALRAALNELIADEGLRGRLVANGRKRYLDEFTKEKTVAAYRAFYDAILARESRAR
jgi:glycosyltransferase involved in cell wall biosynthesis